MAEELKVHVEVGIALTSQGFTIYGEGWRDGQPEEELNLDFTDTFPDAIDLAEPWHDLALYALTRWALYRHYVETQDGRSVIDRAIRARIAALTGNDKLVFAMKVHDSWCDERADTPSDVADAMVSLLAPAKVAELQSRCDDYENREGAVCPEDVPFEEVIGSLRKRVAELEGENADISPVLAEVGRAVRKFPTWPTDPLHALAVVGEEFGELTKAVLQCTYEPHRATADDVRAEATQLAAMAVRFLRSLDRYQYQRGPQHAQDAAALVALLAPETTEEPTG